MASKKLLYTVSANNALKLYFNQMFKDSLKKRIANFEADIIDVLFKLKVNDTQIKK